MKVPAEFGREYRGLFWWWPSSSVEVDLFPGVWPKKKKKRAHAISGEKWPRVQIWEDHFGTLQTEKKTPVVDIGTKILAYDTFYNHTRISAFLDLKNRKSQKAIGYALILD